MRSLRTLRRLPFRLTTLAQSCFAALPSCGEDSRNRNCALPFKPITLPAWGLARSDGPRRYSYRSQGHPGRVRFRVPMQFIFSVGTVAGIASLRLLSTHLVCWQTSSGVLGYVLHFSRADSTSAALGDGCSCEPQGESDSWGAPTRNGHLSYVCCGLRNVTLPACLLCRCSALRGAWVCVLGA